MWFTSSFHLSESPNKIKSINKKEFSIPLSLYKRGLYIRRWKTGDRISLNSSKNNVLISDLFTNNKLSMIGKLVQPIIVDKTDQILWIPGIAHAQIQQTREKQNKKIIKWIQA